MKGLTARQKRFLIAAVEPALSVVNFAIRLVTGDLFRDHSLAGATCRRILVVRLDTIGDVLLSEPAITALREAYPAARIDVIASRVGREVLLGNPAIAAFIEYEGPWHAAWRGKRLSRRAELQKALSALRRLRRERYDLAVELRGDPRDILFMALTGARTRVGDSHRGGGPMLHRDARADPRAHRVDISLAIACAAGASMVSRPPRMYLSEEERQRSRRLLAELGTVDYIAFHLGAGFPSKRLPLDRFAAVADDLCGRDARRRIVVVGGVEDQDLVREFEGMASFPVRNLVGRASLRETAGVLEACRLFVGNDSAPMHIAAAMGTPVVAMFGPSDPGNYGPYGVAHRVVEMPLPCRPCDHVHCPHEDYPCMSTIPSEAIIAAAEELMVEAYTADASRGQKRSTP